MIVENSIDSSCAILKEWHLAGHSVALVPTMGYFHDGHLALMKMAREIAEKVVVSLFVNPTQFGPNEDLSVYPRDFEGDCQKAERGGVDMIFCPDSDVMYRKNNETTIRVNELTKGLCGRDRPVHFQGVTTIVAKLFNIIQPDYAIFGEKDFQQLIVIRRMVSDLDFPVKIIGHPTVREEDGMAMSSRNAYLNPEERKSGRVLYRALMVIREKVMGSGGDDDIAFLLSQARAMIAAQNSCSLEYFTIVEEESLAECDTVTGKCRAMGAIRVSRGIRLIDNIPLY